MAVRQSTTSGWDLCKPGHTRAYGYNGGGFTTKSKGNGLQRLQNNMTTVFGVKHGRQLRRPTVYGPKKPTAKQMAKARVSRIRWNQRQGVKKAKQQARATRQQARAAKEMDKSLRREETETRKAERAFRAENKKKFVAAKKKARETKKLQKIAKTRGGKRRLKMRGVDDNDSAFFRDLFDRDVESLLEESQRMRSMRSRRKGPTDEEKAIREFDALSKKGKK